MIQINPSGQALVIYLDQKIHSTLVINALGLNRPCASSLFYTLSIILQAQLERCSKNNLKTILNSFISLMRGIDVENLSSHTLAKIDNYRSEIGIQ